MAASSYEPFPPTKWSMIEAAQNAAGGEYCQLMNCLIGSYWRPVFCFLRAKGHSAHQAEDLTQEFFLSFLERDWLARADQQRGKFRTFLLTILSRFLSDRGAKRGPKQRLFDERLLSISSLVGDEERTYDPPVNETPEMIFQRQWALATIREVRRKLEEWCRAQDEPDWNEIFESVYFSPQDQKKPTQRMLAEQFNLTRDQVRYALERTEEQFGLLLRAEIAGQVSTESEVDEELREFERLLDGLL